MIRTALTVLFLMSGWAACFPSYPLFYLTPRSAPGHLRERILIVPRPLPPGAPPLLTNRLSVTMDPEAGEEGERYEVSGFHSQDALGRFIFGFHSPDQVRMEARDHDGSVRGSYSYIDPNGDVVKMEYWDNGEGFQVRGNGFPGGSSLEGPGYTPEVQAAREEHFRLYEEALAAAAAGPDSALDGDNGLDEDSKDPALGEADETVAEEEADGVPAAPWAAFEGAEEEGAAMEGAEEGDEEEEEEDAVGVENPDLAPEDLPLTRFWSQGRPQAERNLLRPSFKDVFLLRSKQRPTRHLVPVISGPFLP